MRTIDKMHPGVQRPSWARTLWMDLLRIGLGLVILAKGIEFGQHPLDARSVIDNSPLDFMDLLAVHYVIMGQLVGGVLIILGLVTRLAVAAQIPILAGAVFFIQNHGIVSFYNGRLFAIVILALLLLFLWYGSGYFSVDGYMKRHRNA